MQVGYFDAIFFHFMTSPWFYVMFYLGDDCKPVMVLLMVEAGAEEGT